MMESVSYPSPELLVDDVMLIVLKSLYKREDGTVRLAKFETTCKQASQLVRVHYSTKVKTIVIQEPGRGVGSIEINNCQISNVIRYSNNGDNVAAAGLHVFRQCLSYIFSRVTLITRLIAKASHTYQPPPLEPIALDLEECPKLRLKTLQLTDFWSPLFINLILKHSSTLRNVKLGTYSKRRPQLEPFKLNLKKLDLNICPSWAFLKGLIWAMAEGGSRAESVIFKTGYVIDRIIFENQGDIYARFIQQLSPKSLIWDSICFQRAGMGTYDFGNILYKDNWLEATLNYEIIQDNLRILDLKQANMWYCTWGNSPFTMGKMKKCFPNLQELHLTWIAMFGRLENKMNNVHKLIIDLFTTWPELDATVKFRFMNLGGHGLVINFTEEDMAFVENEPNFLRSTLPNLALIRTCIRNHRHLQPILEIISTGKARAILEFIAQPIYPGDELRIVGYHGTTIDVREKDKCTLEENNSFIVVCEAV